MTKLSVNVNKVATLRNTRTLGIPSVVRAAEICLRAGADGITLHPRPDQRHIRPPDVEGISQLLKNFPAAELNIEGNPFIDYMSLIEKYRPMQATLVPDERDSFTSNQGWNLRDSKVQKKLAPVIESLKKSGCRVSLFVDPIEQEMEIAARLGADRIELYTEPYAAGFAAGQKDAAAQFAIAAKAATRAGLEINAGHDLNLENLGPLLSAIPEIVEVSIGHGLIADALEFGLSETVRKYKRICENPV